MVLDIYHQTSTLLKGDRTITPTYSLKKGDLNGSNQTWPNLQLFTQLFWVSFWFLVFGEGSLYWISILVESRPFLTKCRPQSQDHPWFPLLHNNPNTLEVALISMCAFSFTIFPISIILRFVFTAFCLQGLGKILIMILLEHEIGKLK